MNLTHQDALNSAEEQILEMLPKMIQAASNTELAAAFKNIL